MKIFAAIDRSTYQWKVVNIFAASDRSINGKQ